MSGAVSIDWAPLLPWWPLAALALVSLGVAAAALWRRAPGTWWRLLAAAGLLLGLANPSLVAEERESLDDIAVVLVDESPSQGIGERPGQSAAAVAHLLDALDDLPATEVRVIRAGAVGGAADGGTQLFGPLREALSKVPRGRIASVFVVSDGQIHDVPESLDSLGLDAPLHLLLSGQDGERDRRLVITNAPSYGIVGRPQTLTLKVEDVAGDADGSAATPRLARITLRQDGGPMQEMQVPVGIEQEIEFALERRGPSVLEIAVAPGERELTLANNRAAVSVNGVRDRLRVLLVSGEPHAGERAWRNILKSDPSVDLVHFTILRPPEKQDGTPIRELSLIAFPTRELFELKLDEFDLIIFDRYRRRGVLPAVYLENIAAYVESGGALLEAVGPTFATPLSLYRTPLGRVLPVEPTGGIFEEGYRPRLTELGERHPVTAGLSGGESAEQEPTWGRWFRHVDGDARDGAVVMSGVRQRPLLILDRVGEGRVAQFMSDHMWLWSRGFEGGGPQNELLRRIAHWLMKEPDLEEEDLRAAMVAGRLEIQRRSLSEPQPDVEVTLPSGESVTVALQAGAPGRASASIAAEEAGLYHVSDGTKTALAAAGALSTREFEDARSSAAPLVHLVVASDGGTLRLAETPAPRLRKVSKARDRHGDDWLGLVAREEYLVTGVNQTPLLPAYLLLLLTLGAALLAWHREGR